MSAKDLERQKQSVDNTAKMTQALQTISAIKLGRARDRLDRIRPYTDNMQEMMQDIARGAQSNNPLFVGREEVNTICVCTITSDRGLAGAFNSQVLRQAMDFVEHQRADIVYLATGRKAVEFFNFRSVNLDEVYTGFSDSPPYEKAQEIGQRLTELFHNEEADEVYLFYEQFRSALSQDPTYIRLLPDPSPPSGPIHCRTRPPVYPKPPPGALSPLRPCPPQALRAPPSPPRPQP